MPWRANAPIVQPGNTTISCLTGQWFLVSGSNCQMWVNATQNLNTSIQTRTNTHIAVIGTGKFFGGRAHLQRGAGLSEGEKLQITLRQLQLGGQHTAAPVWRPWPAFEADVISRA